MAKKAAKAKKAKKATTKKTTKTKAKATEPDDDEAAKKKKAAKKPKAKRKSRTKKDALDVRQRLFWGVFNHAMKPIAKYAFNQRKAAEKRAKDQLMVGRHRRVYVPEVPAEASWALSRHPYMAKMDGITLAAEVETELDRHDVDSLDVRREQAGYFEAIDEASAIYRNSVEGDVIDEQIEVSRKAK